MLTATPFGSSSLTCEAAPRVVQHPLFSLLSYDRLLALLAMKVDIRSGQVSLWNVRDINLALRTVCQLALLGWGFVAIGEWACVGRMDLGDDGLAKAGRLLLSQLLMIR